ncbi:hypothetical protein F2P56_034803 [Juglans regia]|uniref:Uncharacterized protein n=2 Tax=Juglans regia TaxID=51240 RepID=A0A833WE95_JUGRE|nr:uncharacterized protein LOC109001119 [Juglans regia]KAF5445778.1 hypothetical protein F2P56_034803 [Juglans regia]
MAGMLPGVECARRRRMIHGSTRRSSSLCLYTISHENHHTSSSSSSLKRSLLYKSCNDEELSGAAREAKERLDERLTAHRKSETKRSNTEKISSFVERKSMVLGELQKEALGSKQSGPERFSWMKLSWKSSDQNNCAVCM